MKPIFDKKTGLHKKRYTLHSAAEMDECIYANWAAHVRPMDTVYHLGDVTFGDRDEVSKTVQRLRSLPGKKYLVRRVLPCAAPATG